MFSHRGERGPTRPKNRPRPHRPIVDTRAHPRTSVLADRTLVLNRSWLAVNVTSVKRAIGLVYTGLARVIQPETYETHDFFSWTTLEPRSEASSIRTVASRIRAPEVIVLIDFDARPSQRVPFTRRNLFHRDNSRCQYCGLQGTAATLGIDHIVPRSRGGTTTWTNCVLACHDCNVRKGSRLPHDAGMSLTARPVQPRWPTYLAMSASRPRPSWKRFLHEFAEAE